MSHEPKPQEETPYRPVTDGDLSEAIPLSDFLVGLGVAMRLPDKSETAEAPPTPARRKLPRRSRIVTAAIAGSMVVALAITLPAFLPARSDALPAALLGRWQTPSPKYVDRGFEVQEDVLYLQRGADKTEIARFPIQRVRVIAKGHAKKVDIFYLDNGTEEALRLTLDDTEGMPALALRNQPDVMWHKSRGR